MYNTNTNTSTYTVIDVKKAFEGFSADLRMIARKTEKWNMEYLEKVVHDVLIDAEKGYLKSVDIILLNSNNQVIKAAKYLINSDGSATSSERAGNNDWPNNQGDKLTVMKSRSQIWKDLPVPEQQKFRRENPYKSNWGNSNIDNSFPNLNKANGQLYASKGFELQKTNFE